MKTAIRFLGVALLIPMLIAQMVFYIFTGKSFVEDAVKLYERLLK
jgi:hypothetical protein